MQVAGAVVRVVGAGGGCGGAGGRVHPAPCTCTNLALHLCNPATLNGPDVTLNWVQGAGVQGAGVECRVQGSGAGVQVQGAGVQVQGAGSGAPTTHTTPTTAPAICTHHPHHRTRHPHLPPAPYAPNTRTLAPPPAPNACTLAPTTRTLSTYYMCTYTRACNRNHTCHCF